MGNCTQPTVWLVLGEKSVWIQNVNPHAFTGESRFSSGTALRQIQALDQNRPRDELQYRVNQDFNHHNAGQRTIEDLPFAVRAV